MSSAQSAQSPLGRFDDGPLRLQPVHFDLQLDSVQQHDRVIDDDAAQRNDAEKRHEPHVRARQQQADDDADQAQWDRRENDRRPPQRVELAHEEEQDDETGNRQFDADRFVRFH